MSEVVAINPRAPRRPEDFTQEQMDLLKRTLGVDLSDDEFALWTEIAKHCGLDPFRKQIYAVKRRSRGENRMVVMTGIDGYRAIAARTGLHAGTDDPIYEGASRNKQYPGKATITVYKLIGGMRVPFTASARWEEYVPPEGQNHAWKRSPHLMLGKCAEALALRRAFPEELAGVETEETIAYDIADRTITTSGLPEDEPSREEEIAERYQALPVNDKVAFAAWTREQDYRKPYSDAVLDAMDAKLDELAGTRAETPAEPEPPAEPEGDEPTEGRICAVKGCDEEATVEEHGIWTCEEHRSF